MPQLVCSECGEKLPADAHPTRKTCPLPKTCAEKRKSRLKTARKKAKRRGRPRGVEPEHDYRREPMHAASGAAGHGVSSSIDEIGHKVIAEELRPLIREALTDNVLLALRQLVGITPDIVARLAEDVNAKDPVVRQKAYGLVLRYVLGHGAVQPKDDAATGAIRVIFDSMPRPDGFAPEVGDTETPQLPEPAPEAAIDSSDVTELQPCEDCGVDKPVSDFDNDAPRCRQCVSDYKARQVEAFGLEP